MRLLLGLSVMTWVCWGHQNRQQTEDTPELTSVKIEVSTTFGAPIPNAAFWLEYFQGLEGGVMNTGDVALGEAAAQIGVDLKAGNISPSDVASTLRSTLCQH